MVYLDNSTNQQEVWIPRNDGLGSTHKGSYDQGFEDGYVSGETHQKNLLSSTAFTENGEYEMENGWSAVTVNVPQTGSTAKLEEKSVTISADTTYVLPSSGYDGMSAVTIDAEQYGQDNYDSGFDDGYTDGYSSGTSEGYDSGYTSGHTDGVNEEKAKLSATTFTANTAVTISDGGYSAITVNVPQTGSSIPLSSITITENTAITETEKAYSAITVNVPQTGHTDQELEDAYNSGYTSGETHQKSLLSSTAFTENGSYTAENGWSGITVNIDTASTYNSGYTSGHTDGVSEEKAKMSAITFTANTAVTLSDGSYSAVTVNVPQTSIEPNKSFTATTNGNYTITPSSGSVIVNGRFDSDLDRYYLSAITENFPSTGYFEILRIEDESDSSKGWIDVYLEDGFLDYDETEWNGGEIVDLSGSRDIYLYIKNANSNFDWSVGKDFNFHYEAMSAVTLNVNVPSSAPQYVEYLETDGTEIMFDLDAMLTSLDEVVYFDFMPLTGTTYYDAWYTFVDADNLGLRTRFAGYNVNGKYGFKFGSFNDYDNWYNGPDFSAGTKYECVFTSTGATVNGGFYRYFPNSIGTPSSIHLNGWTGDGVISRCPLARYYGIKIMSGDTMVSNFRPCLDGNGVPCFYETVSGTYIYASGTGNTPTYGQFLPSDDYVSGYTDGYASGYTSGYTSGSTDGYNSGYTSGYTNGMTVGENTIISTFTSTTATTNGVYGSSASPLSSITVNVPQTVLGYTIDDVATGLTVVNPTISKNPINYAFYDMNLSGQLTLTNDVSEIGQHSFALTNITGITWPTQALELNQYSFAASNITGLLTIPSNVELESYAFSNCHNITDVVCYAKYLTARPFYNCTSLSSITLYNTETMGSDCFTGSQLKEIYCHPTTAPSIAIFTFDGVPSTGTFHYPAGSNYSTFQNDQYLSGWTFVGDL